MSLNSRASLKSCACITRPPNLSNPLKFGTLVVEKCPEAKGFIFDGFPRTTAQAEALEGFLNERNDSIEAMVALEVPEDELKTRLLARAETSGRGDADDWNVNSWTRKFFDKLSR